jgi:hypothetical protein
MKAYDLLVRPRDQTVQTRGKRGKKR